ncbi:Card1-like endonuclease domain-containing protein [Helicobacter pylori]
MNKLVIINRAIPGGGKTSLTKKIEEWAKSLGYSISIHSTDEYFIQIDEKGVRHYVFDKNKLNEYHQKNQEAFQQALESNIDIAVCDNTNFESWQSKPYTDMARKFGYKILLIDFKPRKLEEHLEAQIVTKERPDAHQVDRDVLERMYKEHRISSPCLDKTKILKKDTLECPMDYGWSVAQCGKIPRGIAKHYDYDFYLERIPATNQQHYEKQNRELGIKALEFLKYNLDFDVIFHSLGEQLMPVFLGMRQFSAQKHVFIVSHLKNAKTLERFFEERKNTNKNFQINTDSLNSIKVNVFEPKEIYEKILEYIEKYGLKDKRLCFNLTGGTKMVFLAGLKASEYFQTPYFYIEEKAQQLSFFKNPSEIEPFIIPAIPIKDVETFFSLHIPNRMIEQNGIVDEESLEKIQERKNLSNLLYEHRSRIISLYQKINDNYSKDKTVNICENNLKIFYKDHQVCVNIDGKEMKLKYSENEDDFRKYIIGGWFEEYIYFELLDLLDKQVIYDLRLNMRLSVESMTDTQRNERPIYAELDMAFSDGKNLYVVECKSGELKNKGVLTTLSTNTQIFGGSNAKCILISSDDNLGQNIQEKIKILNIKFIFKDFKENIENYINDFRH